MGIIVKNINGEYHLISVSHTPINLTPFTKPEAIEDFRMCIKIGKLKDLKGLKIDKEYPDLDYRNDFEVVEKIPQVKHENGLIFDDLRYNQKK